MLIKQQVLDGIVAGRVTLAFRRWKRPTVKAGGSLRTPIGVLAIDAVEVVDEENITKHNAKLAGYSSRDELMAELSNRREGKLYCIALHYVGADPRSELRQQTELTENEIDDIKNRLVKMDIRSSQGEWTAKTLKLIAKHPGKRAAELAKSVGMETKRFKGCVRKLKELGLTESLKIGYQLSPRGEVVFERI